MYIYIYICVYVPGFRVQAILAQASLAQGSSDQVQSGYGRKSSSHRFCFYHGDYSMNENNARWWPAGAVSPGNYLSPARWWPAGELPPTSAPSPLATTSKMTASAGRTTLLLQHLMTNTSTTPSICTRTTPEATFATTPVAASATTAMAASSTTTSATGPTTPTAAPSTTPMATTSSAIPMAAEKDKANVVNSSAWSIRSSPACGTSSTKVSISSSCAAGSLDYADSSSATCMECQGIEQCKTTPTPTIPSCNTPKDNNGYKQYDTPWKFFDEKDAMQLVFVCHCSTRALLRWTPWFLSHASMLDTALVIDPDGLALRRSDEALAVRA